MTSREQFEAWYNSYQDRSITVDDSARFFYVREAWEVWQASREAVVFDLPERRDYKETLSDHELGFNTALEQCTEAIRAAGIKVKGE